MSEVKPIDVLFVILAVGWYVLTARSAAAGDTARAVMYAAANLQLTLLWILCEMKK